MKVIRIILAAGTLLLAANVASAAFVLVGPQKAVAGDPAITETLWEAVVPPGGKYDRIGLHRYAPAKGQPVAVMFYLPGTNMNGELANSDPDHNLWLYLAARGVTVYALDYRTHFVPNDPVPPLDFMKGWTVGRFVDDGSLALAEIVRQAPELPIFIAGFSRGASYAYILAGARPVAGLIALDGGFKRYREQSFDRKAALRMLAASGRYGSVLAQRRGWAGRMEMMRRAADNPDGPAMGKFPSIGAQVESLLYYQWGPGALANPVDGISSVRVLARAIMHYDRTFPTIQDIEGRAMADQADDPATLLDDHFGHMKVPVLYFGSTGMGADNLMSGIYSASHSGSKDVTINVLEKYGHLDVLYGDQARQDVYKAVDAWIRHHLPQ